MKRTILKKDIFTEAEHIISLIERLYPRDNALIVGFKGEFGSGKTTFIQHIAIKLGVVGRVTSPTFVIEKRYVVSGKQFSTLVHIDAYRLGGETELTPLRFSETIKSKENLILIEWPERVEGVLPSSYPILEFSVDTEDSRTITYHGFEN